MRVSKKNFLKIIKFLEEICKTVEGGQPLLLVYFSAKFILLKNVCLSGDLLCFDNCKITFRKHCKIAIEIKACNTNFQFCFRFL